jgi:Phosphotransferase enzyme family
MTLPPLRYRDVTAEWLTGALQQTWPGIRVTGVEHGPVFGHKKNKFKLLATYENNPATTSAPASFIVKGNFPGENDPSTGSAWAMANELRSFRDIAPLVDSPAMPESYDITITEECSSIVMENLNDKGALFFDAFRTLNLGQAMAFIDAFARMYASSWNSPSFASGGAMGPDSLAMENRRLVNEVYFPTFFQKDNWQAYIELPRGRALPNKFQDMSLAQDTWHRMWEMLTQTAMVVIHGDEHLGNLFVTADSRPGVIDWVARPEHWPVGLCYFMLCSLDILDRRKWERTLIGHFLTRLKAHGVEDPPGFEEAWFCYRCTCFYPVVTWLNNSGIWQPESINTVNAVRAATAAMDHDSLGLLGL